MIGGYSEEAIEKPLHDYQKYATKWLLDRLYVHGEKGAGLFLDPGLGKTRISLSAMDYLFQAGEIKRVLIVAPLRPVYSVWPNEMKRWGFPQTNIILHNQYAEALAWGLKVEFVNFEGLARLEDVRNRWDLLIVDESTFAKNFSTNRSKRLQKMIRTIPKRIILTGTPASNSLADLHAQIYLLDDGLALGKNSTAFRERFCCRTGYYGRQWKVREALANAVREAMQHLVLSMKAEDYLDMPKLIENNIWCKLPNSAYNQYKKLKRELYAQLATGEIKAVNQASAYTKCKQFANGQVYGVNERHERESHIAHDEKIKALNELHEELAGKPLMVFYHYQHDVERIQAGKNSPFRDTPVIRGRMNVNEVNRIVNEWNDNQHHAIICQWQAASHGLNLQYGDCADVACFGVPDSLDIYEQAYRRIYRQGNDNPHVRLHRILVEGTVEEVQDERLAGKHQTQAAFLRALKEYAQTA